MYSLSNLDSDDPDLCLKQTAANFDSPYKIIVEHWKLRYFTMLTQQKFALNKIISTRGGFVCPWRNLVNVLVKRLVNVRE